MSLLGGLVGLGGMCESRGRVLLAGFMVAFAVVFGGGTMALRSAFMMLRGSCMCIFGHVIDSFYAFFRIVQQTCATGRGT